MSGKRERGEAVCASLQSPHPVSAAGLPVVKLSVDGAICRALVDSGCSHCIVHAPYCASWTRKRAEVMTAQIFISDDEELPLLPARRIRSLKINMFNNLGGVW